MTQAKPSFLLQNLATTTASISSEECFPSIATFIPLSPILCVSSCFWWRLLPLAVFLQWQKYTLLSCSSSACGSVSCPTKHSGCVSAKQDKNMTKEKEAPTLAWVCRLDLLFDVCAQEVWLHVSIWVCVCVWQQHPESECFCSTVTLVSQHDVHTPSLFICMFLMQSGNCADGWPGRPGQIIWQHVEFNQQPWQRGVDSVSKFTNAFWELCVNESFHREAVYNVHENIYCSR